MPWVKFAIGVQEFDENAVNIIKMLPSKYEVVGKNDERIIKTVSVRIRKRR